LFPLAIGVIAMDVIDDHYLQPESGTAAGPPRQRACAAHGARALEELVQD
jgi:hypothetical protein